MKIRHLQSLRGPGTLVFFQNTGAGGAFDDLGRRGVGVGEIEGLESV